MENKILETRRVFYYAKKVSWEYIWVKNPLYDVNLHKEYIRQGTYYNVEEYIEKEIPKTIRKKCSHIEYRIQCLHCKGTKGWVRRKDAKYCSSNCRKLANKEKKHK